MEKSWGIQISQKTVDGKKNGAKKTLLRENGPVTSTGEEKGISKEKVRTLLVLSRLRGKK